MNIFDDTIRIYSCHMRVITNGEYDYKQINLMLKLFMSEDDFVPSINNNSFAVIKNHAILEKMFYSPLLKFVVVNKIFSGPYIYVKFNCKTNCEYIKIMVSIKFHDHIDARAFLNYALKKNMIEPEVYNTFMKY